MDCSRALSLKKVCENCFVTLPSSDTLFLVEEDIGRTFCSKNCVIFYFEDEVKRLENQYLSYLKPDDLSPKKRKALDPLKWKTLQNPHEVWREKKETGDQQFTLISEFYFEHETIWCVCICLYFKGVPSFLYFSFSTRSQQMVARYRKGEKIYSSLDLPSPLCVGLNVVDGLASEWREDEILLSHMSHDFFQETLESPDEVWSTLITEKEGTYLLYHFIRAYSLHFQTVWYVIIARELKDHSQVEILEAFPTKDNVLVEKYRYGKIEVHASSEMVLSQMVH